MSSKVADKDDTCGVLEVSLVYKKCRISSDTHSRSRMGTSP